MKPLEFIKKRMSSFLECEETERPRSPMDYQFVPVQLPSGSIAQLGKKVEVKPIKQDFMYFSADWALQSGNVEPMTPYPPSILDVMDSIYVESQKDDV